MSEVKVRMPGIMFGRRKIFTTAEEINEQNVVSEVNKALVYHMTNAQEEEYLYWYRRGLQPILSRTKQVRPDINNKVVVNTANQVCVFKNGYFLTKPASYVSRKDDDSVIKKVSELNEYLYVSGKHQADNEIVNWFHTVGLGVGYVEPFTDDDIPARSFALDPRCAFVVYSTAPGNDPVFGVNMVSVAGHVRFDVFTKKKVFRLEGGMTGKTTADVPVSATAIVCAKVENNVIGEIPIIEYQYNDNRMSAFEAALSLMDEYNLIESNACDGIEQFIQSLCVGVNIKLPEGETANTIRERGMIIFDSIGENKAEFKIITEQLDQTQTQLTLSRIYDQILEKCGVPSTSRDAASTSDNVGAVYLRSGWAVADTDCRNTEDLFKKANKLFDKVFLTILNKKKKLGLSVMDFDLCFVRNDMSNLLVKTQAAMNLKELGFSPVLALERSGLSSDPQKDVEVSKEYIEAKWLPKKDEEVEPNVPVTEEETEKIEEQKPEGDVDGNGEQQRS